MSIKHINGTILFKGSDADGLAVTIMAATKAGAYIGGADLTGADLSGAYLRGAYLGGAYLGGADLSGAYLRGAYLRGADLSGAKLVGERPILQISPIGSRSDYLIAFLTDKGVKIKTVCFEGTIDEFRSKIAATHGDNKHGKEYIAALAMIAAHAEIWTPKG